MVAVVENYPNTELEALSILESILEEAGFAVDKDEDVDLRGDSVSLIMFPNGGIRNPMEVIVRLNYAGTAQVQPVFDVLVCVTPLRPRLHEAEVAAIYVPETLDDIASTLGGEFEREVN